MALGKINESTSIAARWKQYASGGLRNLVTDSPDGATCARKVVLLAAGDLTVCKDGTDTDRPITGLPSGYQHTASVSEVNATVAFIAYW
jgi:hypothetical protein